MMYDLQYSMYKKSCPFLYRYLHIKLDFLQDDMNSMHNTNNFVSNFKYPLMLKTRIKVLKKEHRMSKTLVHFYRRNEYATKIGQDCLDIPYILQVPVVYIESCYLYYNGDLKYSAHA